MKREETSEKECETDLNANFNFPTSILKNVQSTDWLMA